MTLELINQIATGFLILLMLLILKDTATRKNDTDE